MHRAVAILLFGMLAGPALGSDPDPSSNAANGLEALEAELDAAADEVVRDPLEPANRAVFCFNHTLDRFLMKPVARLYRWAVPDPARRAVRRFFHNLDAPVVIVNDLLQLEGPRAAVMSGRFVVNSTLGLAGLFDVATPLGLDDHDADFGQTLAEVGVGAGPYVVLPLLGSSSARDAFGSIADGLLRVDTWLLSPAGRVILASGDGISGREEYIDELEEFERESVDLYAALRATYLMSREAELDGR